MNELIKYKFFTRNNGFSTGIYRSLNCGLLSKDNSINIKNNINKAVNKISKKNKLLILPNQYHSNKCLIFDKSMKKYRCDAIVTNNPNVILGITTADCLPIILANKKRGIIGICHAGWRGLVKGVLENTIKKMKILNSQNIDIQVFIGPCIRKMSYEVSEIFIEKLNPNYQIFSYKKKGKYFYDLPKLARFILNDLNIYNIHDTRKNTFTDSDYFSYRESKKRGLADYGRNISMVMLN